MDVITKTARATFPSWLLLRCIRRARFKCSTHSAYSTPTFTTFAEKTHLRGQKLYMQPPLYPVLDTADAKLVQKMLGTLSYVSVAADSTMLLAAISSISTQQANSIIATLQAIFTELLRHPPQCKDSIRCKRHGIVG